MINTCRLWSKMCRLFAQDIKDIVTCLFLMPVWLLQLPVCRSACYDLAQLQSEQNAIARLGLFDGESKCDNAKQVLRDRLHWLPTYGQVNFKIGILTLNGLAPSYAFASVWNADSLPVTIKPSLRRNGSTDRGYINVTKAKSTSHGECIFSIAAPTSLNSLPVRCIHYDFL